MEHITSKAVQRRHLSDYATLYVDLHRCIDIQPSLEAAAIVVNDVLALRKILCKRDSRKSKDGAEETVQRCRLKPFLTHHPDRRDILKRAQAAARSTNMSRIWLRTKSQF